MMDMHEKREKLQEYLREPGCTPIMCAYDVLSAKLIENAGFRLFIQAVLSQVLHSLAWQM